MSNLLPLLSLVLVAPAVIYSIRRPWRRRDAELFGRLRLVLSTLLILGIILAIINLVSAFAN